MINRLLTTIGALLRLLVPRSCRIAVGENSTVRWWGFRIHGGGSILIGRDSIIQSHVHFDSPKGEVRIGDRCFIGTSHLVCHTRITVGNDVIISWGVTIVDHDSHSSLWEERKNDVRDWRHGVKPWTSVAISPVSISDKVWIGFGASILKGVTIGEGAVIGANAVVTRDVSPYTVVAGNPARVVRRLNEPSRHGSEQGQ